MFEAVRRQINISKSTIARPPKTNKCNFGQTQSEPIPGHQAVFFMHLGSSGLAVALRLFFVDCFVAFLGVLVCHSAVCVFVMLYKSFRL